ncbi:hypothetical protein B1218_36235 [Pseudomonas ogarae]|nr:hypothetical protein B1218_36235 [Pseudomonas ogarae]
MSRQPPYKHGEREADSERDTGARNYGRGAVPLSPGARGGRGGKYAPDVAPGASGRASADIDLYRDKVYADVSAVAGLRRAVGMVSQ